MASRIDIEELVDRVDDVAAEADGAIAVAAVAVGLGLLLRNTFRSVGNRDEF